MAAKITSEELEKKVNECKKMEEALQKSENLYRLLAENAMDLVTLFRDNEIIYVSPSIEDILGYSTDEFMRIHHMDLFHPEEKEDLIKTIKNRIATREMTPATYEYRQRHKHGHYVWLETVVKAKLIENGHVFSILNTRDITRRKKTEQALIESEQKWKNVLVHTPQIGISLDKQANITFVNKYFLKLTGWKENEIIGKNWIDLFVPDKIKEEIRHVFFANIRKTDTLVFDNYENQILTKTGDLKNVAWSNLVTKSPHGEIIDVTCLGIDLTERKNYEMLLEKKNTDLRLAQRIASVGVWTLDPEVGVPEWSEEVYRIYERDPDLGPYPLDEYKNIYKGKWFERFHSAIQGAIIKGAAYDIELKLELPSGKEKWIHAIGEPELESGPKGHKVRGTIQDITGQKNTEESLRANTRLLERITDNMFDMVSLADLEGRYTFAGKSHERTLGYTAEELMEKNVLDLVHPDDLPHVAERFKDLLEKGGVDKVIYRYRHKENHYPWFETVGELLLGENGEPVEVIFSTRDITGQIEAKEEFEKIFSMSLDMICIADINTSTFLKINPAFTETLGFSEDELLAKPFTDFIHPDDIDSTTAVVEKKLQAGEKVINFNNRYRCKDGSYRWLSWVSHPDRQKGVTYAIARDITEEEENKGKLLESKALLDATGSMARVGGWELDAKTHEVTWTDATYRIHEVPVGYKPPLQEAINFFHPEDRPKLEKAIQRALDHGSPYDMEIRFATARGKDLWVRTKCVPEMADKRVVKLKGTFQDITEIKVAENRLRDLKRRNQALLDHSPVCHKIVDLDFNLQYMSANGFKMLKIEENSEVYGKPYPFHFFPETFKNEMKNRLNQVIDTGETITMEASTHDGQGNDIWLDSSLIPVFDDAGNIEYVTVVSADVTQRKHDEKEKNRLEGQLRQAQKMEAVGRLAGGVAHDFNNMLSVILGHTEMALEQLDPSQPLYQDLEEIRNAGQRSADLTRQLLAFARKQTVAPKVLDLNQTVTGMIRMLGRLMGENIDLRWKPGKKIWKVKVDPSQVDQILANLCVNARDAIEGVGKVTIETATAVFDEAYCSDHPGFIPGEYALLCVSDDGCGMSTEILENIFDPFYSSKEAGKGTGLGLSMVYGVVKQNNGFINVYSEPDHGTTFKIYLPRHDAKKSCSTGKDNAQSIERGDETVLLVEDEPSILRMTAMMLEKLGYRVLKARTPGEAIEMAHEYDDAIQLLLTDVVMPEMNGRELAKNVLSSHPNLKRLFMSGYTANVIAHHGVLDEGVNFIQKPFSKEQLGAKVREALKGEP